MTKTAAALLARICEEKGIDLDAKLKKDVDTVLDLMTDELVEEGVAGKLTAMEKRVTDVNTKYREAVNELAKRLTAANGKMNELADAVELQRRAIESMVGKEGRRYMIPAQYGRAQAARDLYAGILADSSDTLKKHCENPEIIQALIEAASLVAWRFLLGPQMVSPEDKAPTPPEFPRLKQRSSVGQPRQYHGQGE